MITNPEWAGDSKMPLLLTRTLLLVLGGVGLWLALIVDIDFVEQFILHQPVSDRSMADALPVARWVVAVGAAGVILLAATLPRLLEMPSLQRLAGSRERMQWMMFGAPLALLLAVAAYKAAFGVEHPLYLLLVREDSVFEYLTALIYFGGFGLALWLARGLLADRERLIASMFATLAFLFLFVALEEISYGQRIFGVTTPEILAESNLQEEISIHNLAALKPVFFTIGPVVIGLGGAFGWLLLGFRHRLPPPLPDLLLYAIPPWFAASYFLPYAFFWGIGWDGQWPDWLIWQDQELLEFVLAGGFLIVVIHGLMMQRSHRTWRRA